MAIVAQAVVLLTIKGMCFEINILGLLSRRASSFGRVIVMDRAQL